MIQCVRRIACDAKSSLRPLPEEYVDSEAHHLESGQVITKVLLSSIKRFSKLGKMVGEAPGYLKYAEARFRPAWHASKVLLLISPGLFQAEETGFS
jgi:hypothetical protein